eukprot:gene3658-4996_t
MNRIVKVQAGQNSVLVVEFDDGTVGEVSLADRLFGSMFEPLKDPAYFAQARVDAFGVISWPNGVDLATDAVCRKIAPREAVQ